MWSRAIPEESSFCEICQEISEGNMIKCMSSEDWTDEYCAGVRGHTRILLQLQVD
jgi:hypothetical protein